MNYRPGGVADRQVVVPLGHDLTTADPVADVELALLALGVVDVIAARVVQGAKQLAFCKCPHLLKYLEQLAKVFAIVVD